MADQKPGRTEQSAADKATADKAAPRESSAERRQALRRQVNHIPFPHLVLMIRELLRRLGYGRVTLRRTQWKGHNRGGGWDLEAILEAGLTCQRVLAQVKHSPHPVQGRCVDELRGVLLREGVAHGLLITTGAFSPVARRAAAQNVAGAVTLIDGERLAELMDIYDVGIPEASPAESDPADAAPKSPRHAPTLLTVTIALGDSGPVGLSGSDPRKRNRS